MVFPLLLPRTLIKRERLLYNAATGYEQRFFRLYMELKRFSNAWLSYVTGMLVTTSFLPCKGLSCQLFLLQGEKIYDIISHSCGQMSWTLLHQKMS